MYIIKAISLESIIKNYARLLNISSLNCKFIAIDDYINKYSNIKYTSLESATESAIYMMNHPKEFNLDILDKVYIYNQKTKKKYYIGFVS